MSMSLLLVFSWIVLVDSYVIYHSIIGLSKRSTYLTTSPASDSASILNHAARVISSTTLSMLSDVSTTMLPPAINIPPSNLPSAQSKSPSFQTFLLQILRQNHAGIYHPETIVFKDFSAFRTKKKMQKIKGCPVLYTRRYGQTIGNGGALVGQFL